MNLQYFVGKACTIFTGPVNRNFSEKQLQDYFVGLVESADIDGLWTKHPITGCKNFYPMDKILAVCEEQVVNDPKIIEKYKEARKEVNAKTEKPAPPASPFIDYEMMAKLSQQAKDLNQKPGAS